MTRLLDVLRFDGLRWTCAALFAVAIYLTGAPVLDSGSGSAWAQSSVRPPANAQNLSPMKPGQKVPGGQDTQGFGSPKLPTTSGAQPSQSALWRQVRGGITGTVSIPDKRAGQFVQSGGTVWLASRNGQLASLGGWILLISLVALAVFFAVRGRIKVDHGLSGKTVERFNFIERFAHWLTAVSFIILALTGLVMLYGRSLLIPVLGKEAFASLAAFGKLSHNFLSFAFMLGILMMLVMWVRHNLPDKYDMPWLAKGGGLFSKGVHPEARKFNTGQKMIFWLVVLGGFSVSYTGVALMFPFDLGPLPGTITFLNIFGLGAVSGSGVEAMQSIQLAHAIVALVMLAVIIAHIYIGSIGMEGAFDAMGSGMVDENWAKEHHSVWYKEEASGSGKS